MENINTSQLLITFLQRLSLHFGILGAENVSFKKRAALLNQLKDIDQSSWKLVNELIEMQLRVDRIMSDKEKSEKNPELWASELELAKGKKAKALTHLLALFKVQGISTEGLPSEF